MHLQAGSHEGASRDQFASMGDRFVSYALIIYATILSVRKLEYKMT